MTLGMTKKVNIIVMIFYVNEVRTYVLTWLVSCHNNMCKSIRIVMRETSNIKFASEALLKLPLAACLGPLICLSAEQTNQASLLEPTCSSSLRTVKI